MSNGSDFKVGDKTEIGLGSDEVRTLPADAGLGFWASQEGNMGGPRLHSHGDQQQQQAEVTVAVVQAGSAPAVAKAKPEAKPNHGGDFDFNSYEPIGGFGGPPNLDM